MADELPQPSDSELEAIRLKNAERHRRAQRPSVTLPPSSDDVTSSSHVSGDVTSSAPPDGTHDGEVDKWIRDRAKVIGKWSVSTWQKTKEHVIDPYLNKEEDGENPATREGNGEMPNEENRGSVALPTTVTDGDGGWEEVGPTRAGREATSTKKQPGQRETSPRRWIGGEVDGSEPSIKQPTSEKPSKTVPQRQLSPKRQQLEAEKGTRDSLDLLWLGGWNEVVEQVLSKWVSSKVEPFGFYVHEVKENVRDGEVLYTLLNALFSDHRFTETRTKSSKKLGTFRYGAVELRALPARLKGGLLRPHKLKRLKAVLSWVLTARRDLYAAAVMASMRRHTVISLPHSPAQEGTAADASAAPLTGQREATPPSSPTPVVALTPQQQQDDDDDDDTPPTVGEAEQGDVLGSSSSSSSTHPPASTVHQSQEDCKQQQMIDEWCEEILDGKGNAGLECVWRIFELWALTSFVRQTTDKSQFPVSGLERSRDVVPIDLELKDWLLAWFGSLVDLGDRLNADESKLVPFTGGYNMEENSTDVVEQDIRSHLHKMRKGGGGSLSSVMEPYSFRSVLYALQTFKDESKQQETATDDKRSRRRTPTRRRATSTSRRRAVSTNMEDSLQMCLDRLEETYGITRLVDVISTPSFVFHEPVVLVYLAEVALATKDTAASELAATNASICNLSVGSAQQLVLCQADSVQSQQPQQQQQQLGVGSLWRIEALETEVLNLLFSQQHLRRIIARQSRSGKKVQEQLARLRDDYSESNRMKEELQQEISTQEKENKSLAAQLNIAVKNAEAFRNQYIGLSNSNESFASQIGSLEQQLKQVEEEKVAALKQCQELREELVERDHQLSVEVQQQSNGGVVHAPAYTGRSPTVIPEDALHLRVKVGDTPYFLEYDCEGTLPVSWLMSEVMRDVDEAHHVVGLRPRSRKETVDLHEDLKEVFQTGDEIVAVVVTSDAPTAATADLRNGQHHALHLSSFTAGHQPSSTAFRVYKQVFTNWINVKIAPRNIFVANLFRDVSDGFIMKNLLEVITSQNIDDYARSIDTTFLLPGDSLQEEEQSSSFFGFARSKSQEMDSKPVLLSREEKLHNLTLLFRFMREIGILPLARQDDSDDEDDDEEEAAVSNTKRGADAISRGGSSVKPADIVDGNPPLVLKLIWLIAEYSLTHHTWRMRANTKALNKEKRRQRYENLRQRVIDFIAPRVAMHDDIPALVPVVPGSSDRTLADLTDSLEDGRVLLALLHSADVIACPYPLVSEDGQQEEPDSREVAERRRRASYREAYAPSMLKKAIELANVVFGVPPLVHQDQKFWTFEPLTILYLSEVCAHIGVVGAEQTLHYKQSIEYRQLYEGATRGNRTASLEALRSTKQPSSNGGPDQARANAGAQEQQQKRLKELQLRIDQLTKALEESNAQNQKQEATSIAAAVATGVSAQEYESLKQQWIDSESDRSALRETVAQLEASKKSLSDAVVKYKVKGQQQHKVLGSISHLAPAVSSLRESQRQLKGDLQNLLQTGFMDQVRSLATDCTTEFARRETILTNRIQQVERLYGKAVTERRKAFNTLQEMRGNIRVLCRTRPPQATDHVCVDIDGMEDRIGIEFGGTRGNISWRFPKVFPFNVSQEEVFEEVAPLIQSVLDGYHACIFAYGQTGTGKTHTMVGQTTREMMGVQPRALELLLHEISQQDSHTHHTVTISILEIYMEKVRDLLGTNSEAKLEVRRGKEGMVIPGLSSVPVTTTAEIDHWMAVATQRRTSGVTNANEHSSRSHLVLQVDVRGVCKARGTVTHGKLHLIDLAGSERLQKSGAEGQALKEALSINKSLSALGEVINARAHNRGHTPFRNSTLTFLLQDSLSGQSKVVFFVCIGPDESNKDESYCSLEFASRAATVEMGKAQKHEARVEEEEGLEERSDMS